MAFQFPRYKTWSCTVAVLRGRAWWDEAPEDDGAEGWEVEVELEVSGTVIPGQAGSRWEPSWGAAFEAESFEVDGRDFPLSRQERDWVREEAQRLFERDQRAA